MRFLVLIALINSVLLYGQQDPGASIPLSGIIEAENNELDEELARCKGDDPCGWYQNEIVLNNREEPWRAVGQYQKIIRFWYSDDPQFADVENEEAKPVWVLRKVEVMIKSTYQEKVSFYFMNGELTCRIFLGSYPSGEEMKETVYFHRGVMIDGGNPLYTAEVYQQNILEDAAHYQQLFLACF